MRSKTIEPNIYKPPTKQIFFCLASAPKWVNLLLSYAKDYEPFLSALLENNFFQKEEYNDERLTIKNIAEQLNYKSSDVTKWLGKIYYDLFELNSENAFRFKTEGVKHKLLFRYYHNNTASFTIWLQQTPRQYETIDFPLVKAKVGTDQFWVKDIYHNIIDGEHEITLFLNGGLLNRYREILYERALFEERIGFFEAWKMNEFEIDKRLLEYYRNR